MKEKKQIKKLVLGKETIAGPMHLRFAQIVGKIYLHPTFFKKGKIMKISKIAFVIILLFTQLNFAVKRKSAMTLSEFTNPKGPSYVPIPNPKSHKDIIADAKYALKKLYFNSERKTSSCKNCEEEIKYEFLQKFLSNDPEIFISAIIKVKNYFYRYAHEYSYLIELSNQEGEPVARICLDSFGLFRRLTYSTSVKKLKPINKTVYNSKIFDSFKKSMFISSDNIEKKEAVMFPSLSLCSELFPAFMITTRDKRIFLINYQENVFEVSRKEKISKAEINSRSYFNKKNGDERIVHDSINDQLLIMRKVQKLSH